MRVRQISIFMENRAGRLREITGIIANAGINIRALSLADTSDFGILRLIVNKPDQAIAILREEGFILRENDVLACVIKDRPGGLHELLNVLDEAEISVEYMYGFFERKTDNAVMILRVENPNDAIKVLQDGKFALLSGEQVYAI